MVTVAEVSSWMEAFAPASLAESWDNVGLLMGDPAASVRRLMTCLTVTPRSAAEAIGQGAEMIVTHHPIFFRPVKTLTAGRPDDRHLWDLARAGVAVYSPHTAFDNTEGGINDGLAARLGLGSISPLRPAAASSVKLVVFTPLDAAEAVRKAAFNAGAGGIGAYDECSFEAPGTGTFRGSEASNPAIGRRGVRERVAEVRLEFICDEAAKRRAVSAIRAAHPYEEPAIDAYPLDPSARPTDRGAGRVGVLARPEALGSLARRVGEMLGSPGVQFVGDPDRPIRKVAICCGAGDDFLKDAVRTGADLLLLGEARFHRTVEAEALGLGLIVAGHHATERPAVEDLAGKLDAAFPDVEVWPSRDEADPLRVA